MAFIYLINIGTLYFKYKYKLYNIMQLWLFQFLSKQSEICRLRYFKSTIIIKNKTVEFH